MVVPVQESMTDGDVTDGDTSMANTSLVKWCSRSRQVLVTEVKGAVNSGQTYQIIIN